MNNISIIIPSRNNLKYLKQAYKSIRKYHPDIELILLDDASTDGTWEWIESTAVFLDSNLKVYRNDSGKRIGHTVLYDMGVKMCTREIFGIFHADMVMSPNYIKNMLKHLGPKVVVSGTRIEPPLHPPGVEKVVRDFGLEPEDFKEDAFLTETLLLEDLPENKDKTTDGVFAPWIMYKEDFINIGGHDLLFAPMELEDSDLFNRMYLAGYKLKQSRDAFIYHMTCRGSRFKDGLEIEFETVLPSGQVWRKPKDSKEYLDLRHLKFREWWRKWRTDVLHTETLLPITAPRYKTAFIITNCTPHLVELLEPWADELWVDCPVEEYIVKEQPKTMFNLNEKFFELGKGLPSLNVSILFDGTAFTQRHYDSFIKHIPFVISQSGGPGIYNWDKFIITIKDATPLDMIQPWFKNVF